MPVNKFACFSYTRSGTHLLSDILMMITGLKFNWPESGPGTRIQATIDDFKNCSDDSFYISHSFPLADFLEYLSDNNYRIILNIRDPRDQLISLYYYYLDHALITIGNKEAITGNLEHDMNEMITAGFFYDEQPITLMSLHYLWFHKWVSALREFDMPVLLINYESMVLNKGRIILKLCDFLGINPDEIAIQEIIDKTAFEKESETQKIRNLNEIMKHPFKENVGAWKFIFTDWNKSMYKKLGGSYLLKMRYEKDNNW